MQSEEIALEIMRRTLLPQQPLAHGRSKVRPRYLDRAKHLLHERFSNTLSLSDVGREVGVSPVHLTQVFKRWEGVCVVE